MLHVGHAAQHGQHPGIRPREAEGPRRHAPAGFALLEAGDDVIVDLRQTAAQQRFHDDGRNAAPGQLAVEVLGVGVPRVDLPGMPPVEVVHLDLHEIPPIAVVSGKQTVEDAYIAVVREAEVAYAARLAFGEEKIEHPVPDVAGLELLHAAAHAHAVQQHVVDVIHLQFAERIAIHGQRRLAAPGRRGEVREFRGDEILLAGVALESDARDALGLPLAVGRGGVEIVHPVRNGEIHQPVHRLLVDLVGIGSVTAHGRPAHAAVSEQRNLLARPGIDAESHRIGRNLSGSGGTVRCGTALRGAPGQCRRRYGGPGTEPFEKLPAADRVSVFRIHTFSDQMILCCSCPST